MVKFGQKLRDNSVVEWHEEGAYVDYKGLKKLIKKLSAEQELAASNGMSRRPSFLGVFTSTPGGTRSLNGGGGGGGGGGVGGAGGGDGDAAATEMRYLMADEPSPVFEAKIREEIAKVDGFYSAKVQNYRSQLELLRAQASPPGGAAAPADGGGVAGGKGKVAGVRAESINRGTITLFRDLSLLENYTMLNYTAFVKILKKHDKMLRRRSSERMQPVIGASQFCRAEQAHALLAGVEAFFAATFCNGERRIARSTLMMKQREDTAQGKVSLGVRGGVCLTLAAWVLWDGMAVTLEQRDPLFISDTPAFPIFRMVFGLLLLFWCWGLSVRVWVETRINYQYMMGFRPKASRSSIEMFKEATNMTIVCLVILLLYYKSLRKMAPAIVEPHFYPVILWFYVHVKMFFPWNARRRHFFTVLWQVVASPFTEVTFFHSIVGDYLTSAVKILIDYAFSWCYLVTGEFLCTCRRTQPARPLVGECRPLSRSAALCCPCPTDESSRAPLLPLAPPCLRAPLAICVLCRREVHAWRHAAVPAERRVLPGDGAAHVRAAAVVPPAAERAPLLRHGRALAQPRQRAQVCAVAGGRHLRLLPRHALRARQRQHAVAQRLALLLLRLVPLLIHVGRVHRLGARAAAPQLPEQAPHVLAPLVLLRRDRVRLHRPLCLDADAGAPQGPVGGLGHHDGFARR
jgi:hypothetical protein